MTFVILASGSETRAMMLKNAGVSFTVKKPLVDEDGLRAALTAEGVSARDMADALAEMKAKSVAMMNPEGFVIGSDQILERGGRIFSKAKNRQEAKETLNALSDGDHHLHSAAVIYEGGEPVWRFVDTVKMKVRPLSEAFIESYLDLMGEDAFWSVGAYQLEGLGAQLFNRVEGSHFTVLGLPLLPLLDFLRRREILPL